MYYQKLLNNCENIGHKRFSRLLNLPNIRQLGGISHKSRLYCVHNVSRRIEFDRYRRTRVFHERIYCNPLDLPASLIQPQVPSHNIITMSKCDTAATTRRLIVVAKTPFITVVVLLLHGSMMPAAVHIPPYTIVVTLYVPTIIISDYHVLW